MAEEAKNETKSYQWSVGMTCNGCVNQISNILKKLNDKFDGDKKVQYSVSLDDLTVTVKGDAVDTNKIGTKIKKWADLKNKSYEFKGQI